MLSWTVLDGRLFGQRLSLPRRLIWSDALSDPFPNPHRCLYHPAARDRPDVRVIAHELRRQLQEALSAELLDQGFPSRPVVFEQLFELCVVRR